MKEKSLVNIGSVYLRLGDAKKALEYLEQSLDIAKKEGLKHEEGNTLGSIGLAYLEIGDEKRRLDI